MTDDPRSVDPIVLQRTEQEKNFEAVERVQRVFGENPYLADTEFAARFENIDVLMRSGAGYWTGVGTPRHPWLARFARWLLRLAR